MKDYRIAVVAAAAWGAGLVVHLLQIGDVAAAFLFACCAAATLCFGCFQWLNRDFYPALAAACVAVFVAAIVTSQYVGQQQKYQDFVSLHGTDTVVTARLTEKPGEVLSPWGAVQVQAKAKVLSLELADGRKESLNVSAYLRGDCLIGFQRGQTLSGFAQLGAAQGRNNVTFRSVRAASAQSWFEKAGNYVQQRSIKATETLSSAQQALVTGSSVGKVVALDPQVREKLKDASLIHLNVISGMHLSIILYALVVVKSRSVWLKSALTVILLGVVLIVVGVQPSVLRAVCSTLLLAAATAYGRQPRPRLLLAVVGLFVTLSSPDIAYSWGFVLSVVATWGVLVGSSSLRRFRAQTSGLLSCKGKFGGAISKVLKKLSEVAVISGCVQMATLPVVASMQSWIPTWGILANLLVFPAVTPLVLASLCVSCISCFNVGLARPFAHLAGFFADWVLGVSEMIASLPMRRIPIGAGTFLIPIFLAALVGWIAVKSYRRRRNGSKKRTHHQSE